MIMRIKGIVTVTAALICTSGLAQAVHPWEDPVGWSDSRFAMTPGAPKYTANELSFDMFGSYINPEGQFNELFKTNIRKGFWGGGAGLNYFPFRKLGLGTDFNVSSKTGDLGLVDYWVGNIYLRVPLGNSGVAPYIYGGGGRGMSPVWDWVYGGGAGLEYRFTPGLGVFSDARFLWSNRSTDLSRLVIRVGVRLVF